MSYPSEFISACTSLVSDCTSVVCLESDIYYDFISCNPDNVKNGLYCCYIIVSYYCIIKVGAINITTTIKMLFTHSISYTNLVLLLHYVITM